MRHDADDGTRRARGRGRRRPRRVAAALALALVPAMAVAACGEGVPASRIGGPLVGVGGGGAGATGGAIVGRWTRVVFIEDGWGDIVTSETTWDFAADSVATRANVTSSSGWTTPVVTFATARWRTEGGDLVIRYVSPDTGTVRFRWRVEQRAEGRLLYLDETPFARVAR